MNERDAECACRGAPTVTTPNAMGDMERCIACGAEIRWDLVDSPFFGFKASCNLEEPKP